MKRSLRKTLLFFWIAGLLLSACNALTENELQGNWKSIEYNINGINQLEVSQFDLELKDGGKFFQKIHTGDIERTEEGTWVLESDPAILMLQYSRAGQTVNWKIVERSKNFLHLTNEETRGFFVEMKFERQP